MVQDRAYISLSASEAMVAFLYMDQAKSHSSTPPAASAPQYTVDFKLGLILEQIIRMMKNCGRNERITELKWEGVDIDPKTWGQNTLIKEKKYYSSENTGCGIIIPGWKR